MDQISVLSEEMAQSIINREASITHVVNYVENSVADYLDAVESGVAPVLASISKIYATVGNADALAYLIGAYQRTSQAVKSEASAIFNATLNKAFAAKFYTESEGYYKSAAQDFNRAANELILYQKNFIDCDSAINQNTINVIQVAIDITKVSEHKCLDKSVIMELSGRWWNVS